MSYRVFSVSGAEVLVVSEPLSRCERRGGAVVVRVKDIKKNRLVKSEDLHVLTNSAKNLIRVQQRYLCPMSSVQVGYEALDEEGKPLTPAAILLFEDAVVGSLEELYAVLTHYKPRKRIPGSLLSMDTGHCNIAVSLRFDSVSKGIECIGEDSVVVAVGRPESDEEGSNHELLEIMSLALRRDKSELHLDWSTVKQSTLVVVKLDVAEVLTRLQQAKSLTVG